jgi:hypothetical protein
MIMNPNINVCRYWNRRVRRALDIVFTVMKVRETPRLPPVVYYMMV